MKTLFFILVFLILSTFLAATIIDVPGDQPTIQAGINVAVDTDTVLVQPGSYVENINYNGKLITVGSLFLTTQDTTYISHTVIDGNLNGTVVTFESGESSSAVLCGFTITNGYAPFPYFNGGGVNCTFSSPSLMNLTITGNTGGYGGGIYCDNSSPSLENVAITDNTTFYFGGGIYCQNNSSPSLMNVTITGNYAGYNGGGIYCYESSPILQNVTVSGNSAVGYGGGVYCNGSSLSLTNVTITDNSAGTDGGGIYCGWNANPTLVNCILWNDSPEEIYFRVNGAPNSITISYSDIQGGEAGIVTNNNGTAYWLEGNIDEDPLFAGTGGYPFSLLEDSPCIDAGNPDPIYYDPEDPGNPGYALYPAMGTIINDMGAYGGPNAIGWPVVGLDDNVIVQTPEVFLHQNYPNPFNPETAISFNLPESGNVKLEIYNIKGQKVKTLMDCYTSPGDYELIWNGRDSNGNQVSSGIYFYRLEAGDFQRVKKMILLK